MTTSLASTHIPSHMSPLIVHLTHCIVALSETYPEGIGILRSGCPSHNRIYIHMSMIRLYCYKPLGHLDKHSPRIRLRLYSCLLRYSFGWTKKCRCIHNFQQCFDNYHKVLSRVLHIRLHLGIAGNSRLGWNFSQNQDSMSSRNPGFYGWYKCLRRRRTCCVLYGTHWRLVITISLPNFEKSA